MNIRCPSTQRSKRGILGFTLEEVVCSTAIAGITVGGLLTGQNLAYKRLLWSATSLLAQVETMGRLEQVRAAKWDQMANPPVDELAATNFPDQVTTLPVPGLFSGQVYATNRVSIVNISSDPPLRMIQVEVTWSLLGDRCFTNSIFTYRSPDQ